MAKKPGIGPIIGTCVVLFLLVVIFGGHKGSASTSEDNQSSDTPVSLVTDNDQAPMPSDPPPATLSDMLDKGKVGPCAADKAFIGTQSQCTGMVNLLQEPMRASVSTAMLSVDYISNQVAANNQFNLKKIRVDGAVVAVTEDAETITLEMAAPYQMPVKANLWADQVVSDGNSHRIVPAREVAANIGRGQYVTMNCFNRGLVDGEIVLATCLLIPSPKYVPSPQIAALASAEAASSSAADSASSSSSSAAAASLMAFQEQHRLARQIGELGQDQTTRRMLCEQSRGADYQTCSLAHSEGQQLVDMGACYEGNVWRVCRRSTQ